MARRSGVLDFIKAFNQTYDTVGRVGQDFELAKVANAKPEESQGFTADDGKQLEAIANAKDEQGNPLYTLEAAPDGSYTVKSNFQVQGADGQLQVAPAARIAQQGVTDFMGQRSAGAMNEGQVNSARQRAMAGVLMKTDPQQGIRMMRDVTQAERDDKRFGWEEARAGREQRAGDQAEADANLMRDVDSQVGEWFKGRLKNPDGTERAAAVDDHLAATQFRAAKLTEAGKLEQAGQVMKDFSAQSLVKIQLETEQRNQALGKTAAALAAGDLDSVKEFYNKYVPDGAKVSDVKRGKDGSIVIERETLDGRKMPSTVMKDTGQLVSALATFKDPMAIYNYSQNEFRNTLALRADARAGSAEARAGRAEVRTAAEFAAEAPQRDLKSTVATMQLALGNAATTQERQAIQERLTAIQGGLGMGKEQPAEVKLATAMLQAGMAPDMRSALEMAVTKKSQAPEEMHKEFVAAGIKNMAKPADAVKAADEVMANMGYTKTGNRWNAHPGAAAPAAAQVPPADQRKVGQVYDTPKGKMTWREGGWEPVK